MVPELRHDAALPGVCRYQERDQRASDSRHDAVSQLSEENAPRSEPACLYSMVWRPRRESNPQTAALEAAALPSSIWGMRVTGGACRSPMMPDHRTGAGLVASTTTGSASRGVDPVPQLLVRDPVAGGPVLLHGQRPSELVERPQDEPLADDAAVQRVEGGGLPPHLALQPAGGRGQVPFELSPQGVSFGGELDELRAQIR